MGMTLRAAAVGLWMGVMSLTSQGAPWIAADWTGKEPRYPTGSIYFHHNVYRTSPVVYRTVLEVKGEPVKWAGLRVGAGDYAYVFLNGKQILSWTMKTGAKAAWPLEVELTDGLKRGRNVLVVSTKADGMSLEGGIGYEGGKVERFGSDVKAWKAQKLAPLTILEQEPFMGAGFDDSGWFAVTATAQPEVRASDAELEEMCGRLAKERLGRLDGDGQWRLKMLAEKGIAIVDWEAAGWGGVGRLEPWVSKLAAEKVEDGAVGAAHYRAEALDGYVSLSDAAVNLVNQAKGMELLGAKDGAGLGVAGEKMKASLAAAAGAIKAREYAKAIKELEGAQGAAEGAVKGRVINPLNRALDNKFSWFDTTALLDSDPGRWGLEMSGQAEMFSSALSPATLVKAGEKEITIRGWDKLQPVKVYNRQKVDVGPVGMWVVRDGKVSSLRPGGDGVVYDAAKAGKLSENWALLVHDMSRGGGLPIELVFLQRPAKVTFKAGERGTSEVTIGFDRPGARFFILKPLKEWRGFLEEARRLTQNPVSERDAGQYIEQCRLWSRAVLEYPVTYSESFVRDAQDKNALVVADVYNYQRFEDEWNTKPLRLASLPALASYGLLMNYPGLKVVSEAKTVGSWGIWGDHIAAVDRDSIVYRVPLDRVKRFGGFTSYCFGDTDIGMPGSRTEIATIKSTGSNSFRPQHNQTGEKAIQTARWCWEQGIQNVFNIDEKWIPDAVEHYRRLAEQCKDFPPDAIAYDLLNEPETREPRAYGALMRKITAGIRAVDKTHLIYVEVMPAWGPGAKPFPQGAWETCQPTGDPLTVYSFHDYDYRLTPRWPNEKSDVRDLLTRWIPAFRFAIDNRCPIHLGEFGGFEQTKESVYDNACAMTMMTDFLNIFDQFGWHWHYYANRGITRVRQDGSLEESHVQGAYRRYFARGRFNLNR